MFIFEDGKLIQDDEIIITNEKEQIIFTTPTNINLLVWLKTKKLPEYFFEDIENDDQSIAYDDWEYLKHITVKYIFFEDDEFLLYEEDKISLIIIENKLLFLSNNSDVTKELAIKFQKRIKRTDHINSLIYKILDILVDNAMIMIDKIDEDLEKLEDEILDGELEEEIVQKSIYHKRRTLNKITKLFIQKTDLINKIYHDFDIDTKKNLKYEFLDLKEHVRFLINESKILLDRTGYLLNVHMGLRANKMNQAMQKLASISIIFMPLTFIVGNYGMNFGNMPEIHSEYGYTIVTIVNIVVASGIFLWLKKKRWM
jgi:magnesium transporter